jgi:hypothetical protein
LILSQGGAIYPLPSCSNPAFFPTWHEENSNKFCCPEYRVRSINKINNHTTRVITQEVLEGSKNAKGFLKMNN